MKIKHMPSVMILRYEPDLKHSIWVDYYHRKRSERALVKELKRQIKAGEILGYRLFYPIDQVLMTIAELNVAGPKVD